MAEDPFIIETLGKATIENPIARLGRVQFIDEDDRILQQPFLKNLQSARDQGITPASFPEAGPSRHIFFGPEGTRAAVVTCGGLCPGINSVVRAVVMHLWFRYGVKTIMGVRYGFQGLAKNSPWPLLALNPDKVVHYHEQGGSNLGSSRGAPPVEEMVATLKRHSINILFVVGGDGSMRGALAISREIKKQGQKIAVVGIPKTIDNDIPYVRRSFGFETAVSIASEAARAAHNEANGTPNGIGLVRLMGRHSGYIAAATSLATAHANFCLVPEVDFAIDGEGGLLHLIEKRMQHASHTLVIVAEGAGQQYFKEEERERDASGNLKPGNIGMLLRDRITAHFKEKKIPTSVKYIDPSYLIRSAPANPADNLHCNRLAQNAVHAAMSGRTAMLVGFWHGRMTYVPMTALEGQTQRIRPHGDLWFNVLETTGQPERIGSV